VRRFGTWVAARAPARRSRTSPPRVGRRSPLDRALHGGTARRAARGAAARTLRRRSSTSAPLAGMGKHLRGNEALWRGATQPRSVPAAQTWNRNELRRFATGGIRAALERGTRPAGDRRCGDYPPPPTGGGGLDAGRVSASTDARDEPCDRWRDIDRPHTGSPAATTWFCPTCQPAEPGQGGEELVEGGPFPVEAPELGVAADRDGRRSGSGAPSSRPVASSTVCRKAGFVVERDLLVGEPTGVEERLRARTQKPATQRVGIDLDPGHSLVQTQ